MEISVVDENKKNGIAAVCEIIKADHLKKSFGNNQILKDVSFRLNKNENLAVMGRSGSGKSVLIKCIVGLLIPDSGALNVLGYDVLNSEEDEINDLRRSIGYLFQGGALYDSMSVERNLKFPLRRLPEAPSETEIDDLVVEVLESVGLIDARKKMPSELSGGMKKRIALARTLILKPKIMLYDEPTTGLDIITSNEISDLILSMREKYNMSSMIITHDISCVDKTADRIFILEDGLILAEGDRQEIRQIKDPKIRSYFEGA